MGLPRTWSPFYNTSLPPAQPMHEAWGTAAFVVESRGQLVVDIGELHITTGLGEMEHPAPCYWQNGGQTHLAATVGKLDVCRMINNIGECFTKDLR
ncbi:hypothetical protein PIB30_042994 [Stylosanthes scabra]|uniref:Uncharacterized protein n=1 Tax=Stylosanthes scabra TaxID=79078 RepID=A0ABU6TF03_9FABA|nr:hypothetical protein [Stylosanthes scabra]